MVCFGILREEAANFEQDAIHLFLTVFSTIIILLQYIHMGNGSWVDGFVKLLVLVV